MQNKNSVPLSKLLMSSGDHPCMGSGTDQVHFEAFKQLGADCLGALQDHPAAAYGVWCRDPLYLGAALFALWHHGSRAILLPNAQPETLLECLEATAGVISDEKIQNCSKPLLLCLFLLQAPRENQRKSKKIWPT